MAITLSHLGELLVEAMAKANLDAFYKRCDITRHPGADWEVANEMPLVAWEGRNFDPKSRVDLGIRTGKRKVTPVEIKLGTTGLGVGKINALLNSWERSAHNDPRWKGSMFAILDRQYPPETNQRVQLKVTVQGANYQLDKNWIVIARREVVGRWQSNPPDFKTPPLYLIFEDLAADLGEAKFDTIVKKLIGEKFYKKWLGAPTKK